MLRRLWHAWHARRLARQLARVRAGAARFGLDLSALSDADLKQACEDTRIDPELDGLDAEGATKALNRAVARRRRRGRFLP